MSAVNANYGGAGSVEANAYKSAEAAENTRDAIMSEIKSKITGQTLANDVALTISALGGVDIGTGPGSLVLDDKLNTLGIVQGVAAQVLASQNRNQKEVGQKMG
ncbi:hypothetical protein A2625_07650 [candidate division WOR-1 bacterium RIFCSPHIGHO2_01_FULL_53_15]|uniref:Uncharacterized protein n=1 Tax=candidate division WOR-1 bacterium RIFCSPHIGHO2_01_FULL_53_15 TaxID=1802564 RepID=A0A1F4Q4T2_UNCSA|nr:MAG: hypothetical protein A2625_07650 [candidate division WOR-1 bacterium RIFCSPHIGHO2_01_FULL_53_15]OGC10552.1 MAG: hypothetical protein A3D23_01515 [candidate division WOR-1 bacterium RIFCSPHIGHO2_02_FULL_53_26]